MSGHLLNGWSMIRKLSCDCSWPVVAVWKGCFCHPFVACPLMSNACGQLSGSARKRTKNICTNGFKAGREGFAVRGQMLVLLAEPACTGMQARRETSAVTLAVGKDFVCCSKKILLGLQRATSNPAQFLFWSPCFRLTGGRLTQTSRH